MILSFTLFPLFCISVSSLLANHSFTSYQVSNKSDIVNVSLTVDAFHFESGNTPIKFWTRAYNGNLPGPIIRIKQGDTLRITLKNSLLPDSDGPVNTFRLANTTNLHLHGVHISPEGSSDDIFRRVNPGNTGTYVYEIPKDHSPGLYFYHPHVHGSSSLQQGGGMSGALIIEFADSSEIPPELAAMKEVVLVLQHLCFQSLSEDPNPYKNHLVVSEFSNDTLPIRPEYVYPKQPKDYFLINGEYQPTLIIQPGEFQLFRIIQAGINAFIEFQIIPSNADGENNNSVCNMYVVARDGIYVEKPYKNQFPLLTPASRLDLAVKCSDPGKYLLVSRPNAPYDDDLERNTVVFNGTLATLVVKGKSMSMAPPNKLPPWPAYLTDLRNSTGGDQFTVSFHTEGGPQKPGPPYPPFEINYVPFTSKNDSMYNMTLGKLQEWTVKIDKDESEGTNHPFHMHVNPFQVVAIGDIEQNLLDMRIGEWRDTIPLPHDFSVTIRFRPTQFIGHALVHCHQVPHIDLGMAGVALIAKPAFNTLHMNN